MPWLWALTGNSLLDGHECVVGQISQLHPTASQRGGPSLSLQLWKVSYLQSISRALPPALPTLLPGDEVTRDRQLLPASWAPIFYHFCILAVSHLPQQLLHEQGEGGGWWWLVFFLGEEFSVGLEVHFPLCTGLGSPGRASNFDLNVCQFAFCCQSGRGVSPACLWSGCCSWRWLCGS